MLWTVLLTFPVYSKPAGIVPPLLKLALQDAEEVVRFPDAIAARVPIIPIPQRRSPVAIPQTWNPKPTRMHFGITPYSSLPNPVLTAMVNLQALLSPASLASNTL